MGSVAPLAMCIASIILVSLVMWGERILIRGDDSSFVDVGNDCCPVISVSVGGSYADLSGDYQLKENRSSKPEEVCLNGCVYAKDGLPSYGEFCFKGEIVRGVMYNARLKLQRMALLPLLPQHQLLQQYKLPQR
eukprot:TRINITY_DN36346_c0_g1_i1.p1 TRINITY_DN36346_c0_g1~~TRINITY_DN36346_c0_g1_i1.p1  ORF type:complete len:142 (-),score=24.02 TRINITY_DN36346_c0_g1_i1:75-476(-)